MSNVIAMPAPDEVSIGLSPDGESWLIAGHPDAVQRMEDAWAEGQYAHLKLVSIQNRP